MLLRSLLPSWKFFEDIGETAFLFYRTGDSTEGWSEWQSYHQDIQRKLWHLFFNPSLNLQLAEKSALQHCVRDLIETENKNPVSLEIIRNLVERKTWDMGAQFQFKMSIYDGLEWQDLYISPEIERSQL